MVHELTSLGSAPAHPISGPRAQPTPPGDGRHWGGAVPAEVPFTHLARQAQLQRLYMQGLVVPAGTYRAATAAAPSAAVGRGRPAPRTGGRRGR